MNKRLLDSIDKGVATLKADADACILPADRVAHRQLYEAARFLSAAPDLLEALRNLIPLLDEDDLRAVVGIFSPETYAAIKAARVAIAKAEGQ